ncbi:hypothetical protein OAN307_c46840 [Octadecabacter antarcticus 307]|uniref:Uncharacterized protein n=1 Tax=Octadecabacter antarcticus 307 TaxID=391626 RepID=M9RE55_9RHOB|nr:hypothetical protein OAN307_c46840 [Octadecabacter antarcticus 307]
MDLRNLPVEVSRRKATTKQFDTVHSLPASHRRKRRLPRSGLLRFAPSHRAWPLPAGYAKHARESAMPLLVASIARISSASLSIPICILRPPFGTLLRNTLPGSGRHCIPHHLCVEPDQKAPSTRQRKVIVRPILGLLTRWCPATHGTLDSQHESPQAICATTPSRQTKYMRPKRIVWAEANKFRPFGVSFQHSWCQTPDWSFDHTDDFFATCLG